MLRFVTTLQVRLRSEERPSVLVSRVNEDGGTGCRHYRHESIKAHPFRLALLCGYGSMTCEINNTHTRPNIC